MDLRWQPLPGATIVSMKRWKRIRPDLRPLLEDAARQVGALLQKRIRKLEQEAIAAMKDHGLKVHEVPAAVEEEWRTLAQEKGYPLFVGARVSKEMFDAIRSALNEYRSRGLQTETVR